MYNRTQAFYQFPQKRSLHHVVLSSVIEIPDYTYIDTFFPEICGLGRVSNKMVCLQNSRSKLNFLLLLLYFLKIFH